MWIEEDVMRAIALRRLLLFSIGCCFLMGPLQAHGAGFGVFTQGAYALGQSNAVTAHNYLPSAVFFNPALINDLPGIQVEIGTTLIAPRQEFTSAANGATESADTEFFPSTIFYTQNLSDEFSVGLGLFNPFGLGTEWPQDWEGRYLATKSKLTTYNLNPVVSWRVTPNLSLAGGVAFMWLDADLQNKLNMALVGLGGFPDGNQIFKGDGHGVGYNMGLSAKLGERVSLGISYRSEIDIDADGTVSTQLPAGTPGIVAAAFPTTTGKTEITFPRQISAGIAYRITDKALIETGFRWEEWSSFDEQRITFDQPIAGQTEKVTPRDWDDTFAVNIGGQYKFTEKYALLLGFLYQNSPVPDHTFEPGIPDSESCLYSIGFAADHKKFNYAISYGLQVNADRDKNNTISAPDGSTANGDYDAYLHLLGVSFSYRF
jgi:long-chain fatty acid transport protein